MDDDRHPGDVGPVADMQKKYGWYVENRRRPRLRGEQVPPDLRDLIPLAERWGINCDITRHDAGEKATSEELTDLASRLRGRHHSIEDWLYEFFETGDTMSDEAAAFQSLLVFEMEEADGPGISGFLRWALRKSRELPDSLNRARLCRACDYVRRGGRVTLKLERERLEEAERLLAMDSEQQR